MKLRHLTIQNHVTAETVKNYAHENQLTLMEAKRMLEAKSTTVLQFTNGLGEWVTVPHVVEYRENETEI